MLCYLVPGMQASSFQIIHLLGTFFVFFLVGYAALSLCSQEPLVSAEAIQLVRLPSSQEGRWSTGSCLTQTDSLSYRAYSSKKKLGAGQHFEPGLRKDSEGHECCWAPVGLWFILQRDQNLPAVAPEQTWLTVGPWPG